VAGRPEGVTTCLLDKGASSTSDEGEAWIVSREDPTLLVALADAEPTCSAFRSFRLCILFRRSSLLFLRRSFSFATASFASWIHNAICFLWIRLIHQRRCHRVYRCLNRSNRDLIQRTNRTMKDTRSSTIRYKETSE